MALVISGFLFFVNIVLGSAYILYIYICDDVVVVMVDAGCEWY